jgi:hypothetical protein
MRQHSTPQGRRFKPMNVTRNQDLVELWLTCSRPPPREMAIAPYISTIQPRPLPTNMRNHSALQGRQFKPIDVTRNQDLVELWVDMLAVPPLQMTNAAYIPHIRPWLQLTNMCQHSNLQRHQFKPMNVARSQELVVLWVDILAPPLTRTAQSYTSKSTVWSVHQAPSSLLQCGLTIIGPLSKVDSVVCSLSTCHYRPQHHEIMSFRGLRISLQLVPHIVVMGT